MYGFNGFQLNLNLTPCLNIDPIIIEIQVSFL